MNTFHRTGAAAIALLLLASTTGCATSSDLDALRAEVLAEVERANRTADQAAADAAAARQEASAARASAEQAAATAADTNEKLDRMFKKSMYK